MQQDLVKGILRLSTGNLFLAGICKVGTEVEERMHNYTVRAQYNAQETFNKVKKSYLSTISKANSFCCAKPKFKTWNCDDLKAILASLKRKDDGSMPKLKADLAATYKMWSTRLPFTLQEYCEMNNTTILEGAETDSGIMSLSENEEEEENENAEGVETQLADTLLDFSQNNQPVSIIESDSTEVCTNHP